MRPEIEKRLHRVKIALDCENGKCPQSKSCQNVENGDRCNIFYEKCSFYLNDS